MDRTDDSAYVSIMACEAVLIVLWFGDHGSVSLPRRMVAHNDRLFDSTSSSSVSDQPARVCFVRLTNHLGILNLFYVVWDYLDERLFDKRNTSDCAQFSELLGWPISGRSISGRSCSSFSVGALVVRIRLTSLHIRHICWNLCVQSGCLPPLEYFPC